MPTYKLSYFDLRGRGELCRYVFLVAGKEFEDDRIARENWPALKSTTPFGQLPVLDVDGKKLAQSRTIAKYLAREFGLDGKSSWDQALVDQVLDLIDEMFVVLIKGFFEKDEEKKKELEKEASEVTVPKYLGIFEKSLSTSGGSYYVGDDLTLADIAIYSAFDMIVMKHPAALDKCPKVDAHRKMVGAIPKLAQYVANRKASDI